jgi:exopolysaccharide production protein ExoZ
MLIVAGQPLNARSAGDERSGLFARAFGFLDEASYAIYLVHPFALAAPRVLYFSLAGDGITPPSRPGLYALLQFVAAVAARVVVHVGVERPLTRALRRAWKSAR